WAGRCLVSFPCCSWAISNIWCHTYSELCPWFTLYAWCLPSLHNNCIHVCAWGNGLLVGYFYLGPCCCCIGCAGRSVSIAPYICSSRTIPVAGNVCSCSYCE